MKRLQLKCKPIDDLLGGGIESNAIIEIYGEAGTGKTNLCLQISREYASIGKTVAYIDTECVSGERLNQICEGSNYKKILSNILFFKPSSLEEQEKMINNAINMDSVGLIIVDTINKFYRIKLEDDEEGANRSLNRQMTNLQLAAYKKDLYVILTCQVYGTENDDVKPFAGRSIDHMVKTTLKFEKIGKEIRRATIIKHQSRPEGKKAFFRITNKGLE
jgi:DNA repair protein RadB